MQVEVKVLREFSGFNGANHAGDLVVIDSKLAIAWTESGLVAPIENKLMAPPSENKVQDIEETGKEATEPSGAVKPVRRKIKHRKKAVAK